VRGLAQILEDLDAAGVAFRSATEPFDTASPAGRMMVQMLGVFAEFERATIIDRVIAGMERKASRGGWCYGAPPFGYDLDSATGQLVINLAEAPILQRIFELSACKLLGSHEIANQLNADGHRTKAGKRFSFKAVLVMLRNRVYLGEVTFRDGHNATAHEPLIDPDLFSEVQTLLARRGEDVATRASNSSDYDLSGLIVCERCQRHYVGTSATGRSARYRYYTCQTRQRSGIGGCDADRLSADPLDEAALNALVETYERTDLVDEAATAAFERSRATRHGREEELAAVKAKLRENEDTIERYLTAFEARTMPEALCGERIRSLGGRVVELRQRRDDLEVGLAVDAFDMPTEDQIAAVRARIRDAIKNGDGTVRKVLLQSLVAEVRVESRHRIRTYFRLPTCGTTHRGRGSYAVYQGGLQSSCKSGLSLSARFASFPACIRYGADRGAPRSATLLALASHAPKSGADGPPWSGSRGARR
jgi:site-specific DNA recombinase